MFKFKTMSEPPGAQRLIADHQLTPADFHELAKKLDIPVQNARKIGFVAAIKASKKQTVVTLWNGKESQIIAHPGDWVVTNLAPDQSVLRDDDHNLNQYAIGKGKFPQLYERFTGANTENTYGDLYRAISQVEALFLPGGFEILAPWGETQRADAGYLLLSGDEVYGNHKETFDLTYEVLD